MTNKVLVPAALAAAALTAAIPAVAARADAQGEAKLAKILDGRVAGEPVQCLNNYQRRQMQVIDRTALVFKDGDTYYVNRPEGVSFLSWSDVPVFKLSSSDLCAMDMAQLRDRSTGMLGATIVMGKFVPYRKAG